MEKDEIVEHIIFRPIKGGWEVWPNSRTKLPGLFLNELAAERAYAGYIAKINDAKKNRKRKPRQTK